MPPMGRVSRNPKSAFREEAVVLRPSGIGGQAVLEGIMMKNGDRYAVAVRKPDGDIVLDRQEYRGMSSRHPWLNKPFLRGVFNFWDSLVLGMRTLTWSAEFLEEEDPSPAGKDAAEREAAGRQSGDGKRPEASGGPAEGTSGSSVKERLAMGGTVAFSVALAVVIFMLIPMFAARLFERITDSKLIISVLEGLLRIGIFIAYVWAISFMEDIRRTYMYHGAEHKCINCIEQGLPLTVENVRVSSRQHKRCGTSFMLFVMLVSVVVFLFLQFDNILLRMASRVLFVPVIAGISYEILRLAGRSDNWFVNLVSRPGLLLQRLTTSEPTDDMIEVAIRAVEEVFDWKSWQEGNAG